MTHGNSDDSDSLGFGLDGELTRVATLVAVCFQFAPIYHHVCTFDGLPGLTLCSLSLDALLVPSVLSPFLYRLCGNLWIRVR